MADEVNRAAPDPDPSSGLNPDQALRWFLSVVGVGIGVNLLSSTIEEQRWAWIPPTLFALAALTAVPRTGLLRREPHVGSRWTRGVAIASLLVYLGVAIWGTATTWPLPILILSAGFLWGTCVLVTWPTLSSQRDLSAVAFGVAMLLGGMSVVLIGVSVLRDGDLVSGAALLLFGGSVLLYGVSMLREGITLSGVALVLSGVAMLLIGSMGLRDGNTASGGALMLYGLSVLVFGIGMLRDAIILSGAAIVMVGISTLFLGAAVLGDGKTLFGVAVLLFGVAAILMGVSILRDGDTLFAVAMLLSGVAMLLIGVAVLRDGDTLSGVAMLLLGTSVLLTGVARLLRDRYPGGASAAFGQMKGWLTQR